jgi:hypothetical protein
MKLGKVRGVSFELNKNFTREPLWRINSLHGETIIDIPYIQLIYTSGSWMPKRMLKRKPDVHKKLPLRRASNVNDRQDHYVTKRSGRADRN